MSVTIDHLRVEHRVTVLCDFKDLAGVQLRAGERGVLRGLGMDYARMEIWIDLERDSARDTLRFALRAADGPRNGHMREYFEMGDEVDDISVNTTQTANEPRESQSPREEPTRPVSGVPSFSGRQQPHDTNIEQLSVACACDPLFHRPLLSARSEYSVHACLRCGTVTCTRSLGDDGRFTGDAWHINRTIALSDQALEWLAHVPRIKVDYTAASARWPMAAELVRYSTLYYPADTRCGTREELGDLEASLQRRQSGRSVADCLRATCHITNSPPSDLARTGVPRWANAALCSGDARERRRRERDRARLHERMVGPRRGRREGRSGRGGDRDGRAAGVSVRPSPGRPGQRLRSTSAVRRE